MTFISSTVPNLINGISQQPSAFKLATQAEAQLNGVSSVVHGLLKRPPTVHRAVLAQSITTNSFTHVLDYGLGEFYTIVVKDGEVLVYDKDGATSTVDYFTPNNRRILPAVTIVLTPNTTDTNKQTVSFTFTGAVLGFTSTELSLPFGSLEAEPTTTDNLTWIAEWIKDSTESFTGVTTEDVVVYAADALNPIGYLTGLTDPKTQVVATTIADQTYLINNTVVVEEATALTPDRPFEGLIYVKNGDYSTEYKIVIASGTTETTYSYTTRDSSDVLHEVDIKTTNIANDLYSNMVLGTVSDTTLPYDPTVSYKAGDIVKYQGSWYSADFDTTYATSRKNTQRHPRFGGYLSDEQRYTTVPGFTGSMWTQTATTTDGSPRDLPEGLDVSIEGNIIRVWSNTTDFTLTATDDRGGTHLFAYKGQVDDFKKLPPQAPLGFKIRVAGNNDNQQDDYFVHYDDPAGLGKGVWKETTADGIPNKINAATMPHILIKEPDGTFHFKEQIWDDRLVGEEETNPFPSFIGQPINDLFFYRNRLGLLSGENVILSEVGAFWNFFQTTTLVLLDSSPIDIAVSTSKQNELKYAVPFNTSLMLFSDTTQFILNSGQVLAHDTVSVEVSTRFDADLRCKPEGKATFVFFATKRGEFGGVREYYVADELEVNDADNITSHVPEFIDGALQTIAVSSIEDMLVVRADGKPNELYVYNYYWANKEKKQSAWHLWDMGDEVISAKFVESTLVLLVNRPIGTCIETLNLDRDVTTTVMDYGHGLLLDRRVEVSDTAAPTLPFTKIPVLNDAGVVVGEVDEVVKWYNQKGAFLGEGITVPPGRPSGDTFYGGMPYTFEYRFSEFILRNEGRPITPTKLKIKSVDIQYDESGSFDVRVAPVSTMSSTRPEQLRTFSPTIGSIKTRLNKVIIDSGKFKVPVWGDSPAIRVCLHSDSVYPCSFQRAVWTATYTKHSQGT